MAGPVASYVQSWDLQLLCSASVVIGNNFVKEAFSDLCPEISSSKIGGQFGFAPSFWLQDSIVDSIDPSCLCDRMSTRAWKPD
jgi:hypothetical protein